MIAVVGYWKKIININEKDLNYFKIKKVWLLVLLGHGYERRMCQWFSPELTRVFIPFDDIEILRQSEVVISFFFPPFP